MNTEVNWDAATFFETLVSTNKLAKREGFGFYLVAGMEDFAEAVANLQSQRAFVALDDVSEGYIELRNNTPITRRVKSVYLAMRHRVDDMSARAECLETMRELFRQFMTVLNLERTQLQERHINLLSNIRFTEVDKYAFSGCAVCMFQLTTEINTDLRYNDDEWE